MTIYENEMQKSSFNDTTMILVRFLSSTSLQIQILSPFERSFHFSRLPDKRSNLSFNSQVHRFERSLCSLLSILFFQLNVVITSAENISPIKESTTTTRESQQIFYHWRNSISRRKQTQFNAFLMNHDEVEWRRRKCFLCDESPCSAVHHRFSPVFHHPMS